MISACRKHIVAATGSSPFKIGDNQRPERTMSGVRKPPPESSVPGENLNRGSRRNQLRRGHGSPPVLSEVFSSLALRCALQRVQTVPAAIHSGRIPPPQPTSHGDGRLSHPLTTPDMVRSGRVLQPQLNLQLVLRVPNPADILAVDIRLFDCYSNN